MNPAHLLWIVPAAAFVFLMLGGILQSQSKPISSHDDIPGLSPEFRDRQRAEEQREQLHAKLDLMEAVLIETLRRLRMDETYVRSIVIFKLRVLIGVLDRELAALCAQADAKADVVADEDEDEDEEGLT